MSFNTLPPELQEAIVACAPRQTLASLCRTSKSMLDIARPLLYRSIKLDFSPTGNYAFDITDQAALDGEGLGTEGERSEGGEKALSTRTSRPARLFEVLNSRPGFCSYVKELYLLLSDSIEGGTSKAAHLLPSFKGLAKLKLWDNDFVGLQDGSLTLMIESCPRTITSLDLVPSNVPLHAIYRLLANLPLLEALCIQPENETSTVSRRSPITPPISSLRLNHLHTLRLSEVMKARQARPFVVSILKASPNLACLRVDFAAVQALVPADLERMLHLTISGVDVDSHQERASQGPKYFNNFLSVLEACTSLETLVLHAVRPVVSWDGISQLESYRILHRLPLSLRTLVVDPIHFTPSYLFEFLSLPRTNLSRLEVGRFWISHGTDEEPVYERDAVAEGKVEEVCERRKISLVWIENRFVSSVWEL